MQESSLVITGMGAVTPIGIGTDTYWNNLVSGVCGIDAITRFPTDTLPVRIAAEVRGFDADALIPRHLERNMALFAQYGFVAAQEALRDAGLTTVTDPHRIGIVMGTAMDGMSTLAATQAELSTGSLHKVGPRLVPMILGNMTAGLLAIACGFHGPSITVNTACSSGGDAIMTAAMLLLSGEADCILVVGGESILSPVLISSLAAAKALSRNNEEPARASRPFDRDRDGFVIGEGGGALVLETARHAEARGVTSYATLAGYANTQDGYHITSPDPHGAGAAKCMQLALQKAGLAPADIHYLNAHGTSTPMGDKVETLAIHAVFGTGEQAPLVSSTKGATGHMMGAGGITEIIACIKALQTGLLPPTLNYETPDPDCDLNIIANTARQADIRAAMSNSLGFGGQNSSIILTRDTANRR
ncbi:MAG TPA: beta-ketoacyl-[acyl-carrier-protein] synthase family protein [Candidatus Desulfovibrio intestinipullorum]|uniref:3-oxoacyl-[acyl-carrier-protein] synthase 2 n=1 Tax=Candidatus Desulfovibrio intestinipullorum TaxID=2838536 RepID=A0A9D1TPG1_9BACT|nr:beta-ketoacyl-[acyl-carrier-protein] synthase family protein [Candidatus Desulfovibrio intestinipullorum]